MTTLGDRDRWDAGDAYEAFMGRWSRPLAREFLAWLQPAAKSHWLEVGCGTGALTSAVCDSCDPATVVASDASGPFVEYAKAHLQNQRVTFVEAGGDVLPRREGGFDLIVAGLVLNFLPDPAGFVATMSERLRRKGVAAAYVWDYAGGMEFLRIFWDEAAALDPRADALHEGRRFPLCHPQPLQSLFETAGFLDVKTNPLAVQTEFASFDQFWDPLLRGTGPAPAYVASLDAHARESLRVRLETRLATRADRRIPLRARAWAVRGVSS